MKCNEPTEKANPLSIRIFPPICQLGEQSQRMGKNETDEPEDGKEKTQTGNFEANGGMNDGETDI